MLAAGFGWGGTTTRRAVAENTWKKLIFNISHGFNSESFVNKTRNVYDNIVFKYVLNCKLIQSI